MRGDVNAVVTRLKEAKQYADAAAKLRQLIENYPDDSMPQDKARMADLMQQAGDYAGAVVVFQSILEYEKQQQDELKSLVEVVIPTLRRWRSSAKRAGAKDDVERCNALIAQADGQLPMARAQSTKAKILKDLSKSIPSFDYMGWSSASSTDNVCTSQHMRAWRIPSQEFLELVDRHFSAPPEGCMCWCHLLSSLDLERRPWRVVQSQP